MKARGGLVALVCALALAAPAAAAAKPAGLTLSSIKLKESNGHEISLGIYEEAGSPATAQLRVDGDSTSTAYAVPVTQAPGVHASFESLGQLDGGFVRRHKHVETPERGCRWIFEPGYFKGSFHFAGEDAYVTSDATNPKSMVIRLPDGFCGFGDRPFVPPFLRNLRETALTARSKISNGSVSFTASRLAKDKADFEAILLEKVGQMQILRTARAINTTGSFSNHGKSRGSVFPPEPFSGSAIFRKPSKGPASWTGSLAVSFPGAPETALAGETFKAKLCPRKPILQSCSPAPSAHGSYGSGSHSQPLALARLSSLR